MGRAPCCDKNGLKKGPWTAEEDQKLVEYIQKHGYGNWRTLPKNAGLQRCGKSCRLRWTNYLRPDIKRGRFSLQEEETIIQLHGIMGNKWSAIASRLPGRTDNEIKNHWNTRIRKKLLRMGIDPVTHSPRLDLLDISSILSSSLYNSSQMNMSRFLGVQPLVHPELLKLISYLVETQRGSQTYSHDQLYKPQIENQIQRSFMESDPTQEVLQPCSSLSIQSPCVSYPSNINNFSSQYAQLSDSTCGLTIDHVPIPNYNDYTTDQIIIDPTMSEISGFHHSNCSNQSFGFTGSVLSTPSSCSTPLNSNSTHVSSEDEIETYRRNNLLKFEDVPELLDINYECM